jgi:hypothetical protein
MKEMINMTEFLCANQSERGQFEERENIASCHNVSCGKENVF